MSVEGYELGAIVHISDLLQKLDTLGLTAKPEPVQPKAAAPVEPAAEPVSEFTCAECGKSYTSRQGLGSHQFYAHGVRTGKAAAQPRPAPPIVNETRETDPDDDEPSPPPPLRMADAVNGHTATERCPICQRLWRLHETCKSCGAAIGVGHEDRGVNGDCTNCYVAASKKAA